MLILLLVLADAASLDDDVCDDDDDDDDDGDGGDDDDDDDDGDGDEHHGIHGSCRNLHFYCRVAGVGNCVMRRTPGALTSRIGVRSVGSWINMQCTWHLLASSCWFYSSPAHTQKKCSFSCAQGYRGPRIKPFVYKPIYEVYPVHMQYYSGIWVPQHHVGMFFWPP